MRQPPPKDALGNIIPHDHLEIFDSYYVLRHIKVKDLHREPGTNITRVASGAYSESGDRVGGMSVDILDWMDADGLPWDHYVSDPSDGAVKLNVGELRARGFQVGWDELPQNPHHGAVWGIGNGSTRRRRIASIAITLRKADGET